MFRTTNGFGGPGSGQAGMGGAKIANFLIGLIKRGGDERIGWTGVMVDALNF
jgi:hypothetical protein